MPPDLGMSRELAVTVFLAIRLALGLALLLVLAVCIRWAVVTFAGEASRQLGRRRWRLAGANLLAVLLMELGKVPVEKTLRAVGNAIGPVAVIPDPDWWGDGWVGLYHTTAATLGLILMIQLVGALCWWIEDRRTGWIAWIQRARGATTTTDIRADLVDAVGRINRALRVCWELSPPHVRRCADG